MFMGNNSNPTSVEVDYEKDTQSYLDRNYSISFAND